MTKGISGLELQQTPTRNSLDYRMADFNTLAEALDYAAQGETGANFYSGRGELYEVLTYAELRKDALSLARKLLAEGLQTGDRVAMVAETNADFLRFFYACQYARLVPVALPAPVNLGGHIAYETQLRNLLENSQSAIALSPPGYLSYLLEASRDLGLKKVQSYDDFKALPENDTVTLTPSEPDDVAYFQYTSGSTRFPRGVVINQATILNNLQGIIRDGVQIRPEDRLFSWLPFYHDMGLIGFVLVPVAAQVSVDYLDTREFAKRPRLWLRLMDRTKATVSFSPSFGYELCTRRLRTGGESENLDLSNWRVAGIGAEMIRSHILVRFADALAFANFNEKAFLACYGMAECCLAISFAPLYAGHSTDWIDGDYLANHEYALPLELSEDPGRAAGFVKCGNPLADYEVEIRDREGNPVEKRHTGTIYVRGPSVMTGYFNSPEETAAALSEDGWLNTGDIGYRVSNELVITGRHKDLIIINGRNIWPQDLEYVAEHQPETRTGDAVAFSVTADEERELCVLVVQVRETDAGRKNALIKRLITQVRLEYGIDCYVELVEPRSLPRTSSGKLSRAKARQLFIEKHDLSALFSEVSDKVANAARA